MRFVLIRRHEILYPVWDTKVWKGSQSDRVFRWPGLQEFKGDIIIGVAQTSKKQKTKEDLDYEFWILKMSPKEWN